MDSGATTTAAGSAAPSLEELQDALRRFAALDGAGLAEGELVDHLTAMERLKSAIAAAQARVTATLVDVRTRQEAERGVSPQQRGRGLAAEVALARQESPARGARLLGLAKALTGEMPHTLAALTRGDISEWRASLVVRETAVLSRAHRAQVDAELSDQLVGAGDRKAAEAARAIGYRLDPGSAIRRVRGAEADRRVGVRPAPDTMSNLTAVLPVAQGVACYAALRKYADARRADGDARSRGQIMADTLVERVTGQATADGVPVEVHLVMTDESLFTGGHTPARLEDYGVIPAALGRRLVREADQAWVRRLFTQPATGTLVAMDSRRRAFEGQLRRFAVVRDQICRTPWCDAPIRHVDHPTRVADGGATTAANAQGLCEACNYAKEAPGWHTRTVPEPPPGAPHTVETTTPTGHRHRSRAPDLPRRPAPRHYPFRLDLVMPQVA